MDRPPNAIEPLTAAAAMAVLHGARTVREVADALGTKSLGSAHSALRRARLLGLVSWEDDHQGSLHSTLRVMDRAG